jgi:general secretion pathway protein D
LKIKNLTGLALMVVFLLLSQGCANQEVFHQGKSLLEAGKPEDGLSRVRQAMEEQPSNVEYRSYYYRQRDIWINRFLRDADTARVNYRWDDAIALYQRVLGIDADNVRARDGIREVEAGKQRLVSLKEAEESFSKGAIEVARDKVRLVLAEEPANVPARALASRIEQKLATQSTPAARLAEKFRKPVSLEFKEAPIKAVFELLSKASGVNFILDRDLSPELRVSVFVRETTIEAALQNILSSNQLGRKVIDENSALIYPLTKKAEYQDIVVRTFYLGNVEPKQAMELIKTVVKTKDVFIDEKLNILVMRDTSDAVKMAEKLIAAYDLGDPEVLLEVEVLEISTSKLLELGVKYPNQISVGAKGAAGESGQLSLREFKNFNADLGVITITDPALVLNLQATDGTGNLLANPKIRVKNHKKAKIHIGDRVPVITTTSTSTGFSSESVNYLDVGLKLDVEPSVMVADEVSIDIGLEVSNIVNEVASKNGTLTYRIGTRNAYTSLRLKNGETQMLAGLISDEEHSSANRVPGISSLPIIGRLFQSKKDTHPNSEIVLLITPHIIRNITPPDSAFVEFSAGSESGNSIVRPMSNSTAKSMPIAMPQPETMMSFPGEQLTTPATP